MIETSSERFASKDLKKYFFTRKNEFCLNSVAFETEVRQIRGYVELDPVRTIWGGSKASSSGRQSRLR